SLANSTVYVNPYLVQETTIQTGGLGAEAETGGVTINMVPKDGGDRFSGLFAINATGPDLQAQNLTDSLRQSGLTSTPGVKKLTDVGAAVGGPLFKSKLWY